ncbi:MAG: hypothetical protein U5K73_04070 [Halofilum sp. (in: g-proteobacteria)]|nr:hypothetical protein [Halofilum sp. (in: g-proteobacteria)]
MKYTKLLFPMMLLVASGTVFAATEEGMEMSFDEIDANADGIVTRDEADASSDLADNFDALDANADGVLDESEVGVGGPDTGEESESDPAMDEESETETDY